MKIINRILFAFLILAIPLAAVLASVNVSFRLPDIYRYEFNRSGVLSEVSLEVSSEKLANFFSGYMTGKLDDFQTTEFYMGRLRPIFSIGEATAMDQARTLLNRSLGAFFALLLLILCSCAILLRQDRKEAVRFAYRAGFVMYLLLYAGMGAAVLVDELRDRIIASFFLYKFDESDMLPQLLPHQFLAENLVVAAVISIVLMTAGYSAVKRMTRPDRMFY
jgi:hypothetical protein